MNDLPRVLFGIGGLPPGGSETQLLRLLRETHGRSLCASLITLGDIASDESRASVAAMGVPWTILRAAPGPRPIRPVLKFPRLLRLLLQYRPDVVYPWLEETATALVPAAKLLGLPSVIARRNTSGAHIERNRAVRWGVRRVERMADIVTVNSDAVAASSLARGIDGGRIRIVRNGHIPLPPLQPPVDGPVTLGYLANFRREKGHARLAQVLDLLGNDLSWKVLLGGIGPLQETVAADLARRGLDERVKIVGQVRDARAFWAQCHIAVLLSDHEGSPNALIEAGFAGRPLLATAVGGTVEVVDKTAGVLVDPGDVPGTARELADLIADADRRRRLARGAHKHMTKTFSLERCVDGHLAAIRDVVSRR